MRTINNLLYAKAQHKKRDGDKHFLFISYDELVNDPIKTIEKIYTFCGWEPFEHNFQNVVTKFPEDDSVYYLNGLHTIRPVVEKNDNQVILPEHIQQKCTAIDKLMGYL
jgi:hypothetical protein